LTSAERRFDVLVIGSGMGGLFAGALAARSGKKVLVLEENPTCGGAAGVYSVGRLTIESSSSMTTATGAAR
jgi:all-trans-retinol 13,14-reductase